MSDELMGGYAAYTTPNAALKDLANTNVAEEEASILLSFVTGLTVTIVTMVTDD